MEKRQVSQRRVEKSLGTGLRVASEAEGHGELGGLCFIVASELWSGGDGGGHL